MEHETSESSGPSSAGRDFRQALKLAGGARPRSVYMTVLFTVPVFFSLLSWLAGGVPSLTDLAFVTLTLLSGVFLILELAQFPQRFGIGGVVLFGGVLNWFCYDYLKNWAGHSFRAGEQFGPNVVAKAAFLHCLFTCLMTVGIQIKRGDWLPKRIVSVPEPASFGFYPWLVLLLWFIGITPYLFLANDLPHIAIYRDMLGGRGGGAWMAVSRTGNLNYNWGGYYSQIYDVGRMSGLLGIFYALFLARGIGEKALGWAAWTFWTMLAFGSGTRGLIVYMVLPLILLIFMRYQAVATLMGRKTSFRAVLISGSIVLGLLVVVQVQLAFRNVGYSEADLARVKTTDIQGNSMFSEGLIGYSLIPDKTPPFYTQNFPGEAYIRPIPQLIIRFVIDPIPRALWTSKPFDPVWAWYNEVVTGASNGTQGTTISHGAVGGWYFKYGLPGVIEGALVVGWLMGIAERALWRSEGRLMAILMSLGVATWLFRGFRDLLFADLYGLLIGAVVLTLLVKFLNPQRPHLQTA